MTHLAIGATAYFVRLVARVITVVPLADGINVLSPRRPDRRSAIEKSKTPISPFLVDDLLSVVSRIPS